MSNTTTSKLEREERKTMNSSTTPIRVGLIVPSSNVTIETELPALLARHESATFTFHSSRMRMQEVSEEELQTMLHLITAELRAMTRGTRMRLCRGLLVWTH